MLAVSFYDVVLWVHITAVVVAFGVVFAYPVMYALAKAGGPERKAAIHDLQATVGKRVISPGMLVVLLAGAYLATDADVWSEVWVTVPLVLLLVIGGLGGGYLGPREERLATLAREGDQAEYEQVLGQVRTVSYLLLVLVVVAIFFMTTKLGG